VTRSEIIGALEAAIQRRDGRSEGRETRFRCPAHDDHTPSARWNAEKEAWYCDSCGAGGGWRDLARRLGIIPDGGKNEGAADGTSPRQPGARLHASGCTLKDYAAAKQLPEEFLRSIGVAETKFGDRAALRIAYTDEAGIERAVRYRLALEKSPDGDGRFRWNKGSRLIPYGLPQLAEARRRGFVVITEGESDAQTLWFHGVPALGLPGASTWKDAWASYLDGIDDIFVVIEPDAGGAELRKLIGTSPIRNRVKLVTMPDVDGKEIKDPSALHLAAPERFDELLKGALAAAKPLTEAEAEDRHASAAAAFDECADLARAPDILAQFEEALLRDGYCGDTMPAKLAYLALTSRLFDRPVSIAMKGPTSAGKSFAVERALTFFPPEAYYELTAMSERALAYGKEPLAHRMLVLYEAAGMAGELASYFVRSLLSEGRIKYEFAEKTPAGIRTRLIEREGPTGLIVTTTAVGLHAENETRLLSVPISDTQEQTAKILDAIAAEDFVPAERAPWIALQVWLAALDNRVTIPFAGVLARLVPPVAVRLRRDFKAFLHLIRAHAVLHQATRERDAAGKIIATFSDYELIRDLVEALFAEGVGALVPETARETVDATSKVISKQLDGTASVADVGRELGLDRSAASRRVAVAIKYGFLRNRETNPRRRAKLVLGEPIPNDTGLFPAVATLPEACRRARDSGGDSEEPEPGAGPGEAVFDGSREGEAAEADVGEETEWAG
jgi:hypothetical protein